MPSAAAAVFSDQASLTDFIRTCGSKPRVWAYCRVSTAQQEQDGLSLAGQRAELEAFCAAKGFSEVAYVEEVGSAGKPMLSVSLPGVSSSAGVNPRPLFALLLSALVSAPGSTLLVWKLDRFSRIASEQEMMLQMLWSAHTTVLSTQVGEADVLKGGGSDPSRVLMRQIFGSFAQYERAVIQMRMQLGLRAKAASGGWTQGRTPYGYTMRNNDLVINESEAHVIRLVFYLHAHHCFSLRHISDTLTRFGYPSMGKSQVKRLLDRGKLYRGIYVDPFNGSHHRDDLRILPDDLEEWAAQSVNLSLIQPMTSTPEEVVDGFR